MKKGLAVFANPILFNASCFHVYMQLVTPSAVGHRYCTRCHLVHGVKRDSL